MKYFMNKFQNDLLLRKRLNFHIHIDFKQIGFLCKPNPFGKPLAYNKN